MLTAADLGKPFAVTTNTSGFGGATSSSCPALDGLTNDSGSGGNQHEAHFTAGTAGPTLDEFLTAGDPSTLSEAYTRVHTALTSCKSWTLTSNGKTLTFKLTPINFGGPDSTAVRLDGTVDGVELNGYLAFEEFTTVLLGYVYFQAGSGSSQLAHADYTQATAKIEHVLATTPSTAAVDTT